MSITLLKPVGTAGAESGKPAAHPFEPTMRSSVVYAQQYLERLRQAEAQRLRRAALRARRSLAARLLG